MWTTRYLPAATSTGARSNRICSRSGRKQQTRPSPFLIYNKDTGSLYFDQDGTGSAAQVQFAKLATNLKMTAAKLYIL